MADGVVAQTYETRIQRFRKREKAMREDRQSWESHWRDIQEFISPRSGRFCLSEGTSAGRKKSQRIINNAPTQASKALAAGMMSGLTSPARPWFRLLTQDPNMMEVDAVKMWLFTVETRMRDVLARSNLYQCLPNIYRELGDYGTAAMLEEEDADQVVRFYPFTIGSYWIATDYRRDTDTLFRGLNMTVRQVVDKFGIDKVSERTRSAWNNGSYERDVRVRHMICPNDQRQYGKLDAKNKPWLSCYWEDTGESFLRVSGYDTKPFMAPRWDVLGEDTYGSSPGMDALGDAKMLQVREKQFALAVDKHVDPPLWAGALMNGKEVNALPGTVTFVNTQGASSIGAGPIYQTAPDYNGALEDKRDIVQRIRDTYYTNLFLMLQQMEDAHFTPEVARELQQEKLLALGPVLERLNPELLDLIITRTFNIMAARGFDGPNALIPPPPPQLQGANLRVEYISILSQAQKSLMVGTIGQVMQFVGSVAQMYPPILDKVDFDQSLDELATDLGAPPSIVVSDDKVAQIRKDKAAQIQRQQMLEAAPAAAQYAQAAKNASQAVAQPGSLLGAAGAAINAGLPSSAPA